jgi:hypothetical protein
MTLKTKEDLLDSRLTMFRQDGNAKHLLDAMDLYAEQLTRQKDEEQGNNRFAQGFLCAVVSLIRMNGEVDTRTRELFQSGGYKFDDLESYGIDKYDLNLLIEFKNELQ